MTGRRNVVDAMRSENAKPHVNVQLPLSVTKKVQGRMMTDAGMDV